MPPEHPRSHEHPDDRHGSDSTEEQEPPVLDSEARLRALVDRHIGEAIRECRSIDHEIARAIAAAMHDLTAPACQDQLLRFILLAPKGHHSFAKSSCTSSTAVTCLIHCRAGRAGCCCTTPMPTPHCPNNCRPTAMACTSTSRTSARTCLSPATPTSVSWISPRSTAAAFPTLRP